MQNDTKNALLACLTALALLAPCANAETAVLPAASNHGLDGMAPHGRWAARLTLLRNSYDHRYDDARKRVDLDTGYDGLNLATLGLAGRLNLDADVVTEYTELMLGYGVTPDLTVGAIIPYVSTTRRVRYSVDGGIGSAGLQVVLTGPLGYKPLGTSTTSGFGDPTLGALWRFHRGEHDSAIVGLGVRFGMAKEDDPDDLMDVPPSDGSTDLRARLEYFRDLGRDFDLRLLAEYQPQFADTVTTRAGNPLTTTTKERLRRDLGDYWEFDAELGKSFGDWRVAGTWHRYQEGPDRYSSSIGTDTSYLSANTDTLADQLRFSITWSGIRAWRTGWLPMPLIVKLEMQDAVAGRNFVDVRDMYLRITSFF